MTSGIEKEALLVIFKQALSIDWSRAHFSDDERLREVQILEAFRAATTGHPSPLSSFLTYTIEDIISARTARGMKGRDRSHIQKQIKEFGIKPIELKGKPQRRGRHLLYNGLDVRLLVIGDLRDDHERALLINDATIQDRADLKRAKEAQEPKRQSQLKTHKAWLKDQLKDKNPEYKKRMEEIYEKVWKKEEEG